MTSVAADEAIRSIASLDVVTDPAAMASRLGCAVFSADVVHVKHGRRALVRLVTDNGPLLAKVRVGHRASSAFKLMRRFRGAGFTESAGVAVAEPIAAFDDIETWVQREAPGRPGEAVVGVDPFGLARVAAEAALRIHRADIPARRSHGVADELAILDRRFTDLAERRADLARPLSEVLRRAEKIADTVLVDRPTCGVHRDFYPEQLLVAPTCVTVIDFDLYCRADPALDLGNFVGHLQEHAIRLGKPDSLAGATEEVISRYCEMAGEPHRAAIDAYAWLTLARHISLSQEIAGRSHTTDVLIARCLGLS